MLPGPPEVEAVIAGEGWAAGRDAPGNTARRHEHQLAGPRPGAGAEGGAEGYRDARRAGLGRRRGGARGDAIHHGGRQRGGLREGQGPLRGDGRDDRSRGRERGWTGHEGREPDRCGADPRGRLGGPGARLQSRRGTSEDRRGALRGPGGEQGHGGQARQAARPRLRARRQGRVSPQRPRDSAARRAGSTACRCP